MNNYKKIVIFGVALFAGWHFFYRLPKIKTPSPYQLTYKEFVYGPSSNEAKPMLIFLHGTGGNETNWVDRFSKVNFPLRVISFRAPHSRGRGYDWGSPTQSPTREIADNLYAKELSDSIRSIENAILELTSKYPTKGKPFVSGFSSGAFIVYGLALQAPEKFSAFFPVGGKVPPTILSKNYSNSSSADSSYIEAYHGASDGVVSLNEAKLAIERLLQLKRRAQLIEFPGGHNLDPSAVTKIIANISKS